MIEKQTPHGEEQGEGFSESSEEGEISTQGAMIDAMRRYRATKRNLEADEQRAQEYLEQVKGRIELDLAPARERLEKLRASMEDFVNHENEGRKFRVPGLGTAYTSRKIHVEIDDAASLEKARRGGGGVALRSAFLFEEGPQGRPGRLPRRRRTFARNHRHRARLVVREAPEGRLSIPAAPAWRHSVASLPSRRGD